MCKPLSPNPEEKCTRTTAKEAAPLTCSAIVGPVGPRDEVSSPPWEEAGRRPAAGRRGGKRLRAADQQPVATVATRPGGCDATLSAWRTRSGPLDPADGRRLRQLAQASARLQRWVAARARARAAWTARTRKNGAARRGAACCSGGRSRARPDHLAPATPSRTS